MLLRIPSVEPRRDRLKSPPSVHYPAKVDMFVQAYKETHNPVPYRNAMTDHRRGHKLRGLIESVSLRLNTGARHSIPDSDEVGFSVSFPFSELFMTKRSGVHAV